MAAVQNLYFAQNETNLKEWKTYLEIIFNCLIITLQGL